MAVRPLLRGRRRRPRAAVGSVPLLAASLAAAASPVAAKVVTDGSLGPGRALGGPDYAVTPDLGRQVGGNLFHSFRQLDLAAGESATFSGPDSISRVLARVTGGSPSSIDG